MSRTSKKRPKAPSTASVKSNAIAFEPHIDTPSKLRLAEIVASVRMHVDNEAWADLLALGRTPVASVHQDDLVDATVFLLRARIWGINPKGVWCHQLPEQFREEYAAALKQLVVCVEKPHKQPEFDLYLDTLNWSVQDRAQAFGLLSKACREMTNVYWIDRIRVCALRLIDAQQGLYDEELPAADRQVLANLPDISLTLREAYICAEQSGELDEEGRALVRLLLLELDQITAGPQNYARVGEALLGLPCPRESDLVAALMGETSGGQRPLSPRALAFMWMLEHTSGAGFEDLLKRFPEPLACDVCEGLRRVLCALVAAPDDVDNHLSLAVHSLMRFDVDEFSIGTQLAMTLGDETQNIDVGPHPLRIASVDSLLLRLLEHSPEGFSRRNELESLCRIVSASAQFSPLEGEDQGDQDMPGLAWLCEQSISFQFAAAYVVQGAPGQMRLLLDALYRATAAGIPPLWRHDYTIGPDNEDFTQLEAVSVLKALERLASVRGQMERHTRLIWLSVAVDLFAVLSKIDDTVRAQLLPLAREFSDDLLEQGHAFRLAYLEQVAGGDAHDALHYYLIDLGTTETTSEASVRNAKLLWARSEDLTQVQGFVEKLQAAVATTSSRDVVKQLLTDAKARLATLSRRGQFERTAVSRWPSLTAPARKLLGVFASINRYNGLAEVAEYAGMDLTWASRHYEKLIDLGMLLVTEKTFRINPYIAPLLERESQHAVIGRIVRSRGTSAVKQVFNSQREFTIYQMLVQLCPNHLVFPNCSLQSVMSYERMKDLVSEDDFGYYLRASVDIVVVSSTTYLPMLAIEVDSVWHDTERQQRNDEKKDRLFASAGIPFMRLRPVGSPSENTIRAQVAEHVDELARSLRADLPGYDQARGLLEDLAGVGV